MIIIYAISLVIADYISSYLVNNHFIDIQNKEEIHTILMIISLITYFYSTPFKPSKNKCGFISQEKPSFNFCIL